MSKSLTQATENNGHITRNDIESKLRQIRGEVDETTEQAKPYLLMGGLGALVLTILLVYLLGRRSGKKRTTIVEIKRV